MRTTLVSILVVFSQWGMPAQAQQQAEPLPGARPSATNWTLIHPPTKRLFFFVSDPKNPGRATVFGNPAKVPRTGSVTRSHFLIDPVPLYSPQPAPKFPARSLLPKKTLPPQDLWKFVRPKNQRLFFFNR